MCLWILHFAIPVIHVVAQLVKCFGKMQPQSYSDLIYPIADEIRSYCHAEMNF